LSFVVSILLYIAQTAKRPDIVILEEENELNSELSKCNNQN